MLTQGTDPPVEVFICSVAAAAVLLRINYATLWRWVRCQKIPAQRLGGQYLLDLQMVLAPFNRLPPVPEDG